MGGAPAFLCYKWGVKKRDINPSKWPKIKGVTGVKQTLLNRSFLVGFGVLGFVIFLGFHMMGFRDVFFLKVGLLPGGWDWQVRKHPEGVKGFFPLGAGFKYFFMFTPICGKNDPIGGAYFSNGLVQTTHSIHRIHGTSIFTKNWITITGLSRYASNARIPRRWTRRSSMPYGTRGQAWDWRSVEKRWGG